MTVGRVSGVDVMKGRHSPTHILEDLCSGGKN